MKRSGNSCKEREGEGTEEGEEEWTRKEEGGGKTTVLVILSEHKSAKIVDCLLAEIANDAGNVSKG